MASEHTLTRFPNLLLDRDEFIDFEAHHEQIFNVDPELRKEDFVFAWASLLQAYAEDEIVQFVVDGCVATVGSESWSAEDCNTNISYPERATGVLLPGFDGRNTQGGISSNNETRHQLVLSLEIDQSSSQGSLKCSGITSSDGLYEIRVQLEQQLARFARGVRSTGANVDQSEPRLSVVNQNPRFLEGPQLLHELVGLHRPLESKALDFLESDGTQKYLSYDSLDSRSSALAERLRIALQEFSFKPEDNIIIPVLIPQSLELYVALLGILKAGAAFCPMTLDTPAERMQFIFDDVSAKCVVTTDAHREKILHDADVSICTVDVDEVSEHTTFNGPIRKPRPKDIAYIMYTSGSTGKPKGVALPHLAVSQSLLAHDLVIPHYTRFLQFASPTFDVSMFEIFFTLYRGSTIVGCNRSDLLNDLPDMMNKLEVDAAELTPTVAGSLLRSRDNAPKLNLLLTIGEMLTGSVVEEFGGSSELTSMLWGMYGPTEAAIHCTLQPSFPATSKVGLIGQSFETVSAFVVAPTKEGQDPTAVKVLPLGHVGELVVGGHQLASGYLNRPEQTAEVFIDHPIYGPLYRTGDKARLLADGETFECLGRISAGQVKLRGQRLELGEIEQAVLKSPGCVLSVATVSDDSLIVFCTGDGNVLSEDEVFDTCRRWLPAFMLPTDVVMLESFPRLPSGKIDRKGLQRMKRQDVKPDTNDAENDSDALETTVRVTTEGLLDRSIGVKATLSRNGLDSLAAIRLASELRRKGYSISPMDILEEDSVKRISSFIRESGESGKISTEETKEQAGFTALEREALESTSISRWRSSVEHVLPCTPLQAAMLAETSMNAQAYCNWVEIEVESTIQDDQIRAALCTIVRENEVLRTGFTSVGNTSDAFCQVVWKPSLSPVIETVSSFNYDFEVSPNGNLLWPLRFQIVPEKNRILIQLHHAIYDGWSLDIMLEDLNLVLAGKRVEPRQQFREVVKYYDHLTKTGELDSSRDYWEQRLVDYQPAPLPNLSLKRSTSTEMRSATLDMSLQRRLATTSERFNCHPQVIFQAALASLLRSYTGAEDLVFGTVTSGRTIPVTGIEGVVGPCISTLPLRVDANHGKPLGTLIKDIGASNRQMLQHCTLSLQEIKHLTHVDPGRPLFDTLFVWQESFRTPDSPPEAAKVVSTADFLEFNLVIEVTPFKESLELKARYRESVFPNAQAEIFLGQLSHIVSSILDAASVTLGEVSNRIPEQFLSIENAHPKSKRSEASLASYVEIHAQQQPQQKAISIASIQDNQIVEHASLTYHDLNTRANKLARRILEEGIQPDDLVCVCVEKSVELYVSILAAVKTGAGYLPITPETPENRVRLILSEAKVTVCLVNRNSPSFLHEIEGVLVVDAQSNLNGYDDSDVSTAYLGSHVAYAVFTSGSTGVPKGVLVTQENLTNNIDALGKLYPVKDGSKLLQACSQAFDVSAFEIFFSWFAGMCLCSGTNDVLFRDLEAVINFFHVTHLSLTPTVAALVDPTNIPQTSFLVTAGEGVTDLVFQRWAGQGLFNGYGPSETTNICSVNPNTEPEDFLNNVGPPLENTSAFVLREGDQFELVPRGGIGELCFGGYQVFRGYLNAEDLTASKILDHAEYGRIYRSGDLGRLLHDGSIVVLGRTDDQVKVRGQRIELGEINSVLMSADAVQDCKTIVVERDEDGQQQLTGFWLPENSNVGDSLISPLTDKVLEANKGIYDQLNASLPTYMVPTALVPVSRFPMTTQGKIDNRKLAKEFKELSVEFVNSVSAAPDDEDDDSEWTDLETTIRDALSSVTSAPTTEITRRMSFFSLGLDSVSAIPLARALEKAGFAVEISKILKHPTVAQLALRISSNSRSGNQSRIDLSKILQPNTLTSIQEIFKQDQLPLQKIRPCTPVQEAMLSAESASGAQSYQNHTLFEVYGDSATLKECLKKMSERHEILRTCFVTTEEALFAFAQATLQSYEIPWVVIHTQDETLDSEVKSAMSRTISALDTLVPPVKITEIRSRTQTKLVLSMHHVLYDAEAISRLLFEIEQVYWNLPLEPPVSFDLALENFLDVDFRRSDKYWQSLLEDFIPLSFPRLAGAKSTHDQGRFEISSQTLDLSVQDLEYTCQSASVTLLSVCQAAWAKVLMILLGEPDVCFGNVVSGRTTAVEGIDRLVAPCFNTVPVRANLSSSSTNGDLIHVLHRINASSLDHQFTPLRRIQSRYSWNGEAIFDTLFILQTQSNDLDNRIWRLDGDVGDMGFPVVCEIAPGSVEDSIRINLHHNTEFISVDQVQTLFDSYSAALKSCVDNLNQNMLSFDHQALENLADRTNSYVSVSDRNVDVSDLRSKIEENLSASRIASISNIEGSQVTTNLGLEVIITGENRGATAKGNTEKIIKHVLYKLFEDSSMQIRILTIHPSDQRLTGLPSRRLVKRLFKELDDAVDETSDSQHQTQSPSSAAEEEIQQAFSQFSKISKDQIRPNKTIYQLGLDSISAIQIAKILRSKGYKVSAEQIFEHPTSSKLAEYIDSHNDDVETHSDFNFEKFEKEHRDFVIEKLGVSTDDIQSVRPCTALQSGMLSQSMHSDGSIYFNTTTLALQKDLNLDKLKRAWNAVMQRHDILRIGFVPLDNAKVPFVMVCHTSPNVQLPWHQVSHSDSDEADAARMKQDFVREALDSLHQPPWRLHIDAHRHPALLHFFCHHALYDAESLQMILDDVSYAYNGERFPSKQSLEPLLSNIINASEDQDKAHEAFWKEELQDITVNSFPDLTPLRVMERHIAKSSIQSQTKLKDLEQRCQEENVTIQAALQTAWASLLSKYTGEDDVTIGLVLAGRDMEGAEDTVFPSTVTVPFRSNASEGLESILANAMRFNASVRKHQHTPLNQIQRWVGLGNKASFDTILVYQRGRDKSREYQSQLWKVVDEDAAVEYPVSMEVTPSGDSLEFQLVFWDDLIPVEHAEILLKQFDGLLSQVLSGGHAPDKDQFPRELLSALPPKEASIPSPSTTLHGLFEATVSKSPDKIALEFNHSLDGSSPPQRWTYGELEVAANKVADLLIQKGLSPSSLVGVCFEKCPEASIILIGILKAGGAFVAIDPAAPPSRKGFILHDSGAAAFVSTAEMIAELEDLSIPMLCVGDFDWNALSSEPPVLSSTIDPQWPSYCLYTSGSTGTPKGCILTHENAVQAMLSFQRLFAGRWDEHSRWLQFASFHFDVSVLEQFWSWSVGICVVSTPRDVLFEDLAETLRQLRISHIDLTPSLARLITPEDVPGLCPGVFITGGEQLKQEILDTWGASHAIHNGYGPTECTIGVTMYTRVPENGKPSNIGWQFDNVGTYVFKTGTSEIVPLGGVGELCISGKLVGDGYLNRPEQTQSAFPYIEEYGEKVYRTKDLVRMLYDGSFQFLGRDDDQVKLRGQRLELGEVNNAVKQSSSVVDEVSTLVIKQNQQQSAQLVSFVVYQDESNDSNELLAIQDSSLIKHIRNGCRDQLPAYMVPSQFVLINFLPLTANNKADTKRLEALFKEWSQSQAGTEFADEEGEMNETEKKIIDALQTFFGVQAEEISRSSNIYNLGLDSVSVFGFARTLRKGGLSNAQPAIILGVDTVSALGKALVNESGASDASVIAAKQEIAASQHRYWSKIVGALGPSKKLESLFPCTPLQQGMIARSLDSDKSLYFNGFVYELSKDINLERLKESWRQAHASLPILQTQFIPVDDGYLQAVVQDQTFPWSEQYHDNGASLSSLFENYRRYWVERNQEWISEPWEIIIVRSESTIWMRIHLFHALYDAVSLDLLLQKVNETYQHEDSVDYGPRFHDILPYGPLQQPDGCEDFWKAALKDADFNGIPNQNDPEEAGTSLATLSIENFDNLESLRKDLNVTHQTLIQAVWMAILQQHIGAPTTLGFVVSGRSIDVEDAERVIGPMFNTIPLFITVDREDTWATLIWKCHEFNVAAVKHQHTPLRQIAKWCKPQSRSTLFNNLFVFQKSVVEDTSPTPWTASETDPVADYPLAFEAEQSDDLGLKLSIVAQGAVADNNTCNELLNQFRETLNTVLQDPKQLVTTVLGSEFFDAQQKTFREAPVNGIPHSDQQERSYDKLDDQERVIVEEVAALVDAELGAIDAKKSIFELGLDSIDAIKLSSRLKRKSITISVSNIMRSQNILDLARLATSSNGGKSSVPNGEQFSLAKSLESSLFKKGLDLGSVQKVLPATPLQEAIVAEMHESEFGNYFNHDIMRLNSGTNFEKLQKAWDHVITHSPILRTSFVSVEDPEVRCSFAQLIHQSHESRWHFIKTSDEVSSETILEQLRQQLVNARETGIPLMLTVWKHGEFTDIVLSISHALYDGWSLGLLHYDVNAAYRGQLELRPSYEDVLHRIVDAGGSDAENFWSAIVSGAEPCIFPQSSQADNQSPENYLKEKSSAITGAQVEAFCRKKGCTAQALGQTCWALVLATYARSLDVTFGVVQSGRDDEESQQVMFPTMNTIAVRSVIHGSLDKMLQYMQAGLADLIQYQHFPLRRIQALAGLQGQKLFNTLFIYQKRPIEQEDLEHLYYSVDDKSAVEYPVCVELEMAADQVIWRIACDDTALSADRADNVLDQLDFVLKQLMESPDTPCINVQGEQISVCGLPSVLMPSEHQDQNDNGEVPHLDQPDQSENWNEAESNLREVLSKVSKVPEENISKSHTIFHLGLDSISAIKVSGLLKKKGIKISVSEILKAGTVADIAIGCQQLQNGTPESTMPSKDILAKSLHNIDYTELLLNNGINMDDVETVMPATSGQMYFLSIWQNSNGILFCPEFKYRLKGQTQLGDLRTAWLGIVDHLPILRTTFVATGRQDTPALQVVLKNASPNVWQNADSQKLPIDFSVPPVQLQAIQEEGSILLKLHIHHALYDAVSLPKIMQHLEDACNAKQEDQEYGACTFEDFVASTISWKDAEPPQFWTDYLGDITSHDPIDTDAVDHTERTELYRPTAMSDISQLKVLVRRSGIPFQSLFLATLSKVLASHRNLDQTADVVLGVYLANRSMPLDGLASLTAPTLNVVPLRIRQPLRLDLKHLAKQIQDDLHLVGSAQHANVGLWNIQKWTGITIDCVVNFLTLLEPEAEGGDVNHEGLDAEGISIESVDSDDPEEENGELENGMNSFAEPQPLKANGVAGAYLPSIDVEAAIRNETLDVGIFCPRALLSSAQAESWLNGIVQGLSELSTDI